MMPEECALCGRPPYTVQGRKLLVFAYYQDYDEGSCIGWLCTRCAQHDRD